MDNRKLTVPYIPWITINCMCTVTLWLCRTSNQGPILTFGIYYYYQMRRRATSKLTFKTHIRLPWQPSAKQECEFLYFQTPLEIGDKYDCHYKPTINRMGSKKFCLKGGEWKWLNFWPCSQTNFCVNQIERKFFTNCINCIIIFVKIIL